MPSPRRAQCQVIAGRCVVSVNLENVLRRKALGEVYEGLVERIQENPLDSDGDMAVFIFCIYNKLSIDNTNKSFCAASLLLIPYVLQHHVITILPLL